MFLEQDVGFVLLFSDLHLWASIFSVLLVNYIFMDGKSDYFQGKSETFENVNKCYLFIHMAAQFISLKFVKLYFVYVV